MSETLTLPVLPLDDEVVLPGMVVPLETSQTEVGAAIDAARMPSRQVPGMRSERPGSGSARGPRVPVRRCGWKAPWSRRPGPARAPTN
jgi:hypothetical protein